MRRSVWLVASLAACGRHASSGDERDRPRVPPIAAIDERCDPAHSRQCLGNDVVACEPDGVLGRRIQACHDGCEDGKCVATCADDGVGLIYVVDSANELLSFDPRKLPGNPFQRIGTLQCSNALGGPFSMSVDRHGVAWVVYDGGELFKVSITDATCQPTALVPGSLGSSRFGMGFVSDAPGSTTEKLFIAAADASRALASIDTHTLRPHMVGAVAAGDDRNPELTGTSEARLYGFFPMAGKPSFVQEIDRATGGARGQRWMLGKASLGDVSAYAFAQWAGVFYVFVTSTDDSFETSSTVRAIDRATGTYRVVLDHLPYRITGAGVSTCAPERDQ
jgi:hypothetical protein